MYDIYVYILKSRKQYSFIALEAEKIFSKRNLKIYKNDYGKPCFNEQGIYLSVTDSRNYFVFGLATIPFGIDMECYRNINYKQFHRLFSHNENKYILQSTDKTKAFFKVWTQKEAYIKFDGRGLSMLTTVDTFDVRQAQYYKNIYGLDFIISIFATIKYKIIIKNISE